MAYGFPGDLVSGDEIIVPGNGEPVTYPARQFMIDFDYIKTMQLEVIAGRDFSKNFATDASGGFIINETGVKELGFKTATAAIGKELQWHPWGAEKADSLKRGRVIGVVKDFHFENLHEKINTAVLQIFPDAYWKVAVKVNSAALPATLAEVKRIWKNYSPAYPIEYTFLDESFGKMYQTEEKLVTLLWIFTAMAIFIGCMGLFGLSAFAAEQRIREIGIRKVLGASVSGIVQLLSKEFVQLVVIAIVIAVPISWLAMNRWLDNFAYRVPIGGGGFLIAAFAALVIAFITVSFQAVKAALTNPVKNLRTE